MLHAPFVRERLLEVLNGWLAKKASPVQPLTGEDLMHAVARGAAYYGAARHGKGVRIRGGIARSYYVGIESAMPAVPGIPAPLKALAVAQFGMEEGTSVRIPDREFGLIVDRAGRVPLLLFRGAQERCARRSDRRLRRRSRRAFAGRGDADLRPANAAEPCAGIIRNGDHRNRNAAALVRGARRAPLEAGVQRARTIAEDGGE